MNYIKKHLFTLFFLLSISIVSQNTYNIATSDGETIDVVCADGSIFTDSNAGVGGDIYAADENYVITFCPEQTGQAIHLDFTSFWIGGLPTGDPFQFDYIIFYNGIANYNNDNPFAIHTGNSAVSGCGNCPEP